MSIVTIAKQVMLFLAATVACLSSCLAPVRSDTSQAKPAVSARSSHQPKSLRRIKDKIPYPFSNSKQSFVKISLGGNNFVTVNLKVYWDKNTPYQDQQNLAHSSVSNFLKYLQAHVHLPNLKVKKVDYVRNES